MKLVIYFASLVIIGVILLGILWGWKSGQLAFISSFTHLLDSQTETPIPTASPLSQPTSASVLGTSEEILLPTALYGLINGLRRENRQSQLQINHFLEQTAQRMLQQPASQSDPAELAQSLGFMGKSVSEVQTNSGHSSWDIFTVLQEDPRAALLLNSPTFSQIGAAIDCQSDRQPNCSLLLLLGEL